MGYSTFDCGNVFLFFSEKQSKAIYHDPLSVLVIAIIMLLICVFNVFQYLTVLMTA